MGPAYSTALPPPSPSSARPSPPFHFLHLPPPQISGRAGADHVFAYVCLSFCLYALSITFLKRCPRVVNCSPSLWGSLCTHASTPVCAHALYHLPSSSASTCSRRRLSETHGHKHMRRGTLLSLLKTCTHPHTNTHTHTHPRGHQRRFRKFRNCASRKRVFDSVSESRSVASADAHRKEVVNRQRRGFRLYTRPSGPWRGHTERNMGRERDTHPPTHRPPSSLPHTHAHTQALKNSIYTCI